MPIYGEAKRRNMARSVLPSTKRRYAKFAKRHHHHVTRSRVRAALRDYDTADIHLDAQRYDNYRGIKEAVFERRDADKLGPFMRWAEASADALGDTPAERIRKLRSMLPEGIIGWHAMTHIAHLPEFATEDRYVWRRRFTPAPRRDFESELAARPAEFGDLNRMLSRTATFTPEFERIEPRYLRNLADIPEFVKDTCKSRAAREALEEFLDSDLADPSHRSI